MTDKFDLLILAELQQDARLPTPELAHRVGLSAPACYRRVRALRESGLIEREVALVAPSTMGWPITMLVLVSIGVLGARLVNLERWVSPRLRNGLRLSNRHSVN